MRPLVLVVDENVDNREMYIEYLRFAGFRVTGAGDGAAALAAARSVRPGIILVNVSLPDMDGADVIRALKSDPATAPIRIIALSGHVEPAYRAAAIAAGCDLFVMKPALPVDIGKHIARLLKRQAETASSG